MSRKEDAMQYFYQGYNCSQSVVMAYADLMPLPAEQMMALASPFGGGMGRLREVCGCFSGMLLVLGALEGYSDPKAKDEKAEVYRKVQELAALFEKENGSILCRELLGLSVKKESHVPEERTENYYKKRPCAQLVGMAAGLLEEYLEIILSQNQPECQLFPRNSCKEQ